MRSPAIPAVLTFILATLFWNPALAAPAKAASAKAADTSAIAASIASPDRPQADRERDEWAKPQIVLTFLGARPGMQTIDYLAADGYYSELLARIVGPKGKVIVYNNGGYSSFIGDKLAKRYAGNRVPNTLVKVGEIADLKLPPKSLDAALFVMSYHDVYYTPKGASGPMGDPAQMVGALFTALKPGGVVVVEDHVAQAGSDPADSVQKMHRIDPAAVKRTFEQAGFKFDAEDDTFKNAQDDHSKLVFDPSIRHKTDQFLYRFRKPK
jgi:predicted methyltransferase